MQEERPRKAMTDTQWPRFMVFQQHREGDKLVHNGTVHAPDIELALQNARDVFARRPEAVAMWVVPADVIFSKTVEQLKVGESPESVEGEQEAYYVFGKFVHSGACEYIGEVEAGSREAAMKRAVEAYGERQPWWWWVFPAIAVAKSGAEEAESMFGPADDKTYKNQAEYPTVTMMRQIKSKGKAGRGDVPMED